MKKRIISYLFCIGIVLLASNAYACLCDGAPNPACRAYFEMPVIFSGTVFESSPNIEDYRSGGTYEAKFRVDAAFKGITEKVAVVFSDRRCGPHFEVGKQYIVYAYNRGVAGYRTDMCTRTAEITRAQEDLEFITQLPTMTDGVTIFGNVMKQSSGFSYFTQPVINLPIQVNEISTGLTKRIKTDRSGKFRIEGLPAGSYSIEPRFPRGIAFYAFGYPDGPTVFSIPNRGCAEVDFATSFRNELRGKVVDKNGKGASGVYIQLVSVTYLFKGPLDTAPVMADTISKEDGTFSFVGVAPGKYRAGIGIGGASEFYTKNGRIFYPNTLDPLKAKVINVVEGKKILNLRMVAPIVP